MKIRHLASRSRSFRFYLLLSLRTITVTVIMLVWLENFALFALIMSARFRHMIDHAPIQNDLPCKSAGCDFSAFWSSGRLAGVHDYAGLYNPASLHRFEQLNLSALNQSVSFYYPPPTLLSLVPFAHLPFQASYFLWNAALLLVSVLLLRWVKLPWLVILGGLLSPAALACLQLGQFGVVSGSLLIAGLTLTDRSPGRAGMLALLAIKPQYCVLAPAVILAKHPVRASLAACTVFVAIVALTLIIFGPNVWLAYFNEGTAQSQQILQAGFILSADKVTGVSVFWMLRSFGTGLEAAYAAQALIALIAFILTFHIWRRADVDTTNKVALTVFLSLLATPYGYTDDMVAFSVVLAALAQARGWRIGPVDGLFWLWPILCPIVGERFGVLLTPIVVAIAAWRSSMRAGLLLPFFPARTASVSLAKSSS